MLMRKPYNWDRLADKIWESFGSYGVVCGVGWTKGKNGKLCLDRDADNAIGVYFERLHDNIDIDLVPVEFDGYQVVPSVIGKIVLD
jgi:hypothetical protein